MTVWLCINCAAASPPGRDIIVARLAGRPENRKLDIVLSHYAADNLPSAMRIWRNVVKLPHLKALRPYLFLYCKAQNIPDSDLAWFTRHGEVKRLDNVGRESHTFIWHILQHMEDLANHTLFHQDMPQSGTAQQLTQRLRVFHSSTGLLALGEISKCSCTECFLHHIPKVKEIWAMVRHSFCVPSDQYAVFLKGAFVVSSARIWAVSTDVYLSLLQYLGAPEQRWTHGEHSEDWARKPSNPLSAHVLERSWNVLFNCLDLHMIDVCSVCDESLKLNGTCPAAACQCVD